MNRIVVDPSTESVFRSAAEPLKVCNQSGEVLGYFTPAVDRELYASVQPLCSEEELLRRAAAGGGRTLAEIMADLNKRS
jgi:hypothetical protein